MKRQLLLGLLLLGMLIDVQGQQDPQYTQYMYNMSVINPAYAGSRENLSVGLLYRSQWAGLDGAPTTGTLFGHSPLGSNVGLGLSVITDEIGPVRETNAYTDVSYTLKFAGNHRLAFGVKAGATFHDRSLNTGVTVLQPGDPFFAQDITEVTPNIGAGLFYYTDKYYLSFSVPNMLEAVHLENDNGLALGNETQHYFLTGGYVFDLSANTELKPSFMVKSALNAPTSYDINLNARFYKKFEIGASYRESGAISGLVNFSVTPNIRVGYAYDATTSEIRAFAPSSHEVFLLFDLNFPKKVSRSPRYF